MTVVVLGFATSGCLPHLFLGEGSLLTKMHRPADGATVDCDSGVFASNWLADGEAGARRMMNACILACREHGFVEDVPVVINEKPGPEDGGNIPLICQQVPPG